METNRTLSCCNLSSDLIVTRAKPGSRAARAEQHEGGSCREGLTCVRWSVGSISLPRVQHLERVLTGALVGTVLTEFFSLARSYSQRKSAMPTVGFNAS